MGEAAAAVTAGLLTVFDLDTRFYIPASTQRKIVLYAWGVGFVLANAALAIVIYRTVADWEALAEVGPAWRGFLVGLSYTGLIHLKFANFTIENKDVPFGIEAFYEGAKNYVYRRINRIAQSARYSEAVVLATQTSLKELGSRARLYIDQDALRSPEQKRLAKAWVLRVVQDAESDDSEKRLLVANFILSGQLTE